MPEGIEYTMEWCRCGARVEMPKPLAELMDEDQHAVCNDCQDDLGGEEGE